VTLHHALKNRLGKTSRAKPVAARSGQAQGGAAMLPRSPLEDPDTAAHAWARYKRLMRFMMIITVLMVVASCLALYRENGLVSAHFYVATALGVGFAMLLMSALMGLVFLSNTSGHDQFVVNPTKDDEDEED
jgi:hypothetical protein